MNKRIPIPKKEPVDQAAPYTPVIHAGMKALSHGNASETQQRAVFDWLVKEAAGVGTKSFRTDPCETAFAEGRRFVGLQIIHLATTEVKHDD